MAAATGSPCEAHDHLIAAVLIFCVGFGGGVVALRAGATDNGHRTLFFRMGAALAGSVFLGAGLIHMLGDAGDNFDTAFPDFGFPLAFAVVGFILVLFVECVVFHAASAAEGPYACILTLVLGLHSLLAGIALGIEENAVVGLAILIAILAHKGAAAFALGVSF